MVNQDEIVKQAQQKANDLLTQTQIKTREMRKAANEYVDDLMRRTDEALAANLAELRKDPSKHQKRLSVPVRIDRNICKFPLEKIW